NCSAERADSTRRQPSAAKALAVARPIPRLEPVIRATLSVSFRSIGMAPRLGIRRHAGSRETRPGPASLERDTHQRLRPLLAEHPSSIHTCVSLVVDAGAP